MFLEGILCHCHLYCIRWTAGSPYDGFGWMGALSANFRWKGPLIIYTADHLIAPPCGCKVAPPQIRRGQKSTTCSAGGHAEPERRVVVTGMGVVSCLGHDPDEFYNNLLEASFHLCYCFASLLMDICITDENAFI